LSLRPPRAPRAVSPPPWLPITRTACTSSG